MKFFIDTADLGDIRELNAVGLVDGVTTNPSLIAKSGRQFLDVIAEICAEVPGPVSAEVTATDFDGMMAEAAKLAAIAGNVTIKLPLTFEGLRACRALTDAGHTTNVTLCFSATQALLAAKANATYISPPPSTLKALVKHPLTDKGLDAFLADWAKTGQTIL